MNTPDQDPLDTLLCQSLQSASRSLDGKMFHRQLAARIAKEQRRMKALRLLPVGMGLLAALVVTFVARPKFDFHIGFSSLATFFEKSKPAISWLMQTHPDTNNFLFLWVVLAGVTLIFSLWLTNRETAIFRL